MGVNLSIDREQDRHVVLKKFSANAFAAVFDAFVFDFGLEDVACHFHPADFLIPGTSRRKNLRYTCCRPVQAVVSVRTVRAARPGLWGSVLLCQSYKWARPGQTDIH